MQLDRTYNELHDSDAHLRNRWCAREQALASADRTFRAKADRRADVRAESHGRRLQDVINAAQVDIDAKDFDMALGEGRR